jgi:hypothetical protein
MLRALNIERRPQVRRSTFIPFPLARRRLLVTKLAGEMAAARTAALAEKLLQGR